MQQFFLVIALSLLAVAFAQSDTQPAGEPALEQALNRVAERAQTYITLRQQTPLEEASQEQRNEIQAAQEQLLASQYTVSRLKDAQDVYTVRPGDSLSSIALDFYGDANCWPDVADANGYLEDPDMLTPGIALVMPTLF